MTTKKKIPSIAEQARAGGADFEGWARGDTRLRTTIATKDGRRSTAYLTRVELEAKLQRAQAFKAIRAELELSQPKFARLLHAGPAAVQQWESGRRSIPAPVFALAELAREMPAVRKRLEATAAPMARPATTGTQKRATA